MSATSKSNSLVYKLALPFSVSFRAIRPFSDKENQIKELFKLRKKMD